MLAIYERRQFSAGEKIWFGRYKNLTNVLHWHFESEIIRVVTGKAKIKIGDFRFDAVKDDCFFCPDEELHYIISEPNSQVDIAILSKDIATDITDKYVLTSPKLPGDIPIKQFFNQIEATLSQKGLFYRESLENDVRSLIIDIFRHCSITERKEKASLHKALITKINADFAFITFEEAVRYSGYSASHFSKIFKKLTGMRFSEYINIIKVENAIMLLRNKNATITSISRKCGFTTIRNFNRVFKSITGYTPGSLPACFSTTASLGIREQGFDPTDHSSILL